MKNYIKLLLIATLLSGCATTKEVTEVKTPVIQQFPSAPIVEKPRLEINNVTNQDLIDARYDTIVKSLLITTQQLMEYSDKLETALSVYRIDNP